MIINVIDDNYSIDINRINKKLSPKIQVMGKSGTVTLCLLIASLMTERFV